MERQARRRMYAPSSGSVSYYRDVDEIHRLPVPQRASSGPKTRFG